MEEINNSILKKLYRGEICPDAEILTTEEFIENRNLKAKLYNEIKKELTPEVLKKLEKYVEIHTKLSSMDAENQFIIGFKLASSIIYESLK